MSWYRADVELGTHVKLSRLARRLEIPTYAALGVLHALWSWCKLHRPDGDLDGLEAVDIAHVIGWEQDPQTLLDALTATGTTATGFIDMDPLRVHDWEEYQPDEAQRAIRSRAAKAGPHQKWHLAKGVLSLECPYCLAIHDQEHDGATVKNCPWCETSDKKGRITLHMQTDAKNANAEYAYETQSKRRASAEQTHSKTQKSDANAERVQSDAERRRANAEQVQSDAEQVQSDAEQAQSKRRASAERCRASAEQAQSDAEQVHNKTQKSDANAEQTQSKRNATHMQTDAFSTTSTSTSTSTEDKRDVKKLTSRVSLLSPDEQKQFQDDWLAYPMRKGYRAGSKWKSRNAWAKLTPQQRDDARRAAMNLTAAGQYPRNYETFLSPDAEGEYGYEAWLNPPELQDQTNKGRPSSDFAPDYAPDDPLRDF